MYKDFLFNVFLTLAGIFLSGSKKRPRHERPFSTPFS